MRPPISRWAARRTAASIWATPAPGSFRDALNALDPGGRLYADRFDDEVLHPFAHETCLLAAERARAARPGAWAELADDVGEDPADLPAVLHAGEWEVPLRAEAELLVLAALADVPLLDVEAEGVPLSLVRAAEAMTRASAPAPRAAVAAPAGADLAGAVFLADEAVRAAGLSVPVPPEQAGRSSPNCGRPASRRTRSSRCCRGCG